MEHKKKKKKDPHIEKGNENIWSEVVLGSGYSRDAYLWVEGRKEIQKWDLWVSFRFKFEESLSLTSLFLCLSMLSESYLQYKVQRFCYSSIQSSELFKTLTMAAIVFFVSSLRNSFDFNFFLLVASEWWIWCISHCLSSRRILSLCQNLLFERESRFERERECVFSDRENHHFCWRQVPVYREKQNKKKK